MTLISVMSSNKSLSELGKEEVNNIKWYDAGLKVRRIYDGVINHTL